MCNANKAQTIDPRLTGVGTSLCDANKAQTIDPRLTGVELVCAMLTKHKLLIPI